MALSEKNIIAVIYHRTVLYAYSYNEFEDWFSEVHMYDVLLIHRSSEEKAPILLIRYYNVGTNQSFF